MRGIPYPRPRWGVSAAIVLAAACGGVRLIDLATPRPVPPGTCLVVGFLGGLDAWDDDSKGVRRLALALRSPGRVYAETFENRRAGLAVEFVRRALDANGDGAVDPSEAGRARLVVYGQSLGGGAAVAFAQQLLAEGVPIELLVLVDSVGRGDGEVPPNVRRAANLFQDEGLFVAGEHPVTARDPRATRILGEWEFEYDRPPGSAIRIDDLPWHKVAFRVAHARMDRDPRVWATAEGLIQTACEGGPDES